MLEINSVTYYLLLEISALSIVALIVIATIRFVSTRKRDKALGPFQMGRVTLPKRA